MFSWFWKKAPTADDLDPNRAIAAYGRGDFDEALRRADVILKAGSNVAMSWRFKGECLFELNRYEAAESCFRKAAELGGPGTEEVMFWAALCQYNAGLIPSAVATLQEYLAGLAPDDIERRQQAERALNQFR
jgi:tetratricopeptide (TPR) repeat protein